MNRKAFFRQRLAAALITVMTLSPSITALADTASPVSPKCDETLYITMDPYGSIQESSVVKSYTVNGCSTITDYGAYTKVTNLTNYAQPEATADGGIQFHFDQDPGRFYFEGAMDVNENQLPWNIDVSYRLNGLDARAEDLAGEKGLVEISMDFTPNETVSDYFRNHMSLIATAIVDMDKNLSLEAEGAQIQAMGNLNAVIFAVLPGEERQYTMKIGTNDFSFSGLVFAMQPLTLAQLDHVGDIREVKETLEDSADALDESLDIVLDTLSDMQSGISQSAAGIRQLNEARQIISDTKGQVYADVDAGLMGLDLLAMQFIPFREDTENAQIALNELNDNLNSLVLSVDDLSPGLTDLQESLLDLKDDANSMRRNFWGPGAEASDQMSQMEKLARKTHSDLASLSNAQKKLSSSTQKISAVLPETIASASTAKLSPDSAKMFRQLLAMVQKHGLDEVEDQIRIMLAAYGQTEEEIDNIIDSLAQAEDIQETIDDITDGILGSVGNTGLTEDIGSLITMTGELLTQLPVVEEWTLNGLGNIRDVSESAAEVCEAIDALIVQVDDLTETVNAHHDEILITLEHLADLTDTASQSLTSLAAMGRSLEWQLKTVGPTLNAGTKATLNGLAGILDETGSGLSQTNVIRSAKNTIKDTIDDKWDEYTTEKTTILNIDPDASPISLTSAKNDSPRTVQIILRTEEIKEKKAELQTQVDESFHADGTIFHRIANIFRKIWITIASIFQ